MLQHTDMLAYIMTCLIAAGTPGPGTLAVINSSIIKGTKRTIPLMCGIITGMALVATATILGLSAIILSSQSLFKAVQFIGTGYIFYLGVVSLLRSHPSEGDDAPQTTHRTTVFSSGVMLSVFNPKTIVFFVALLPAFINTEANSLQTGIELTVILLLCTFSVHLIYAFAGSYAAQFIKAKTHWIEVATGLLFIALAIFMLINTF